ncbi:MAG: hypothetical protein H7A36_07045, partial [Chlamydiales bacterium]|nr:hypothetical protein [Chlamydiales bacterium]
MISTLQITLYSLIPFFAALLGSFIGALYLPQQKIVSALQHFVAGVLIAAVSTELLPKVLNHTSHLTVSLGFVIGVIFMLVVEEFAHSIAKKRVGGLITGASVDLFVDGFLIGISFLAGAQSGLTIALSLSLCAFFLSLTVSNALKQRGLNRFLPLLFIACMLPLGAFLGGAFALKLPPIILLETITFGVAALLYLGIEELLAEAHKKEESVWISATFFLGFFIVFVL